MSSEPKKLRTGWTTGACAAAAAQAAGALALGRAAPETVGLTLPRGETPVFAIHETARGDGWGQAAVIKDAGDDPDVTHGAVIRSHVALRDAGGVTFHAGEGVGEVTKPGLPIPPGEPAINPKPREMITAALAAIGIAHAAVTISVPGGAALAGKTWNPRLGIVGGISILGTTGVVRPFSCAAWIASIHRGVDVARATGLPHVVGATGSTSEAAAQTRYPDLPEIAFLDMGDFAGGLAKYLRSRPVAQLTVAGGFAKLTKLGQGAMDLHSGRSQVDFDALAALAEAPELATVNTAQEALTRAPHLGPRVAETARAALRDILGDAHVAVETLVTNRAGDIVGEARDPAFA